MASGGAAMAQDLVVEFDEFERAAGDYQKTATNFDKKKGEFKVGGNQRKVSVKKDSRFHKLATAMEKTEEAIEKKADEMVKILEDHGGKINKGKKDQKEVDEQQKKEMEKPRVRGDGDDDDTPMYLLNADGSVQVLNYDGTRESVSRTDRSGIWNVLEHDGTVWRAPKRGNPYTVPRGYKGSAVKSTKIAPGSTSLSRATEIARFAKGDYGGSNFAAARYVPPGKKDPIILIGDSEGPHSERLIGYPVLRHGQEQHITKVYTEREPCQKSPQCDKWLDLHFLSKNPKLEVEYANDYKQSITGSSRDKEHRDYMAELAKRHKRQGHP